MTRRFTKKRLFGHFMALTLIIAFAIWAYIKLSALGMHYEWQWNRAWRYLGHWTDTGFKPGPLLDGLMLTLGITSLGMIFSFILGLILAVMRLSPWNVCNIIAALYISLWRNTPLLLQLFFVYFLIAPLLSIGPFWSAILALSAFEAAYIAEIFRASLLSVPRTQWEAALSLGFNLNQTLYLVILPQAFRKGMPAFINQTVSLIKDSSLVSAIAVADITMQAQAIVAETFLAFEIWLIVGLIYLLMSLCVTLPGLWLEKSQHWQ